jgi:hypothetical protein
MPKPKLATLRDAPGAAWQKVEQYRQRHNLTTDQMAHKLGTSAGAYRGWKSKGQMPLPMWEQFQVLLVAEGSIGRLKARMIELPKNYWQLIAALGEGSLSTGVRKIVEEHLARR